MSENSTPAANRLPLIIGGGLVVIVLIVAGFLLLGGNDRPAQTATPPATSPSAVSDERSDEIAAQDASLADGDLPADPLAQTLAFGDDGGLGTGIYARDVVLGDAEAPVTMIEYASWTCPFCKQFHENAFRTVVQPAIDAGTVKYITRDFLRNAIDVRASMAARCEGVDFKAASDSLYASQRAYSVNDPEVVDQTLIGLLADQDVTPQRYVACLNDGDVGTFIKGVSDQARAIGVNATPTVFLNGRRVPTEQFADLERLIDEAAAR